MDSIERIKERLQRLEQADPLFQQKQKYIKEVMERVIYLQPQVFKVIVGLGLTVPYNPDKDEYMNFYHVYTKYPHTNKKGLKSIAVSVKSGQAIKVLIKDRPQFMFPSIDKAPFDRVNSVLTIDRISMDITRETGQQAFCKIIFGNKKNLGKIWQVEELAEKMEVEDTKPRKRYHYIYDMVSALNERIDDATELKNFLDLENNTVRINPDYAYTFLK